MRGRCLAACAAITLAGCHTPPEELQMKLEAGPLGFLSDGSLTREAILLRLGHPWAQYEGERIFAYRIGYDGENGWVVPRERFGEAPFHVPVWARNQYSLVLVFDEKNNLQKHRLVAMGVPIPPQNPVSTGNAETDDRTDG